MILEHNASEADLRTIIFAPTGKDSQLMAAVLERASLTTRQVHSVDEFCQEIERGAGAAIIAEEALGGHAVKAILGVLANQPSWSDFPLVLLTVGGQVTIESERLRELRRPLGNFFLLERPIRPETLSSTLEIALRSRKRQYQIRDQIAKYATAQEALRRSEKLAVTGRLAASIAHEINNPLEAVTNLLYLMRSDTTHENLHRYLEQAEQELARVTEITKQTLRFYREPSKLAQTDVATVVNSVLALYNSRLTAARITVEAEINTSSAFILSSAGELRQVLANLIGNAIDAMRHGGRLRIRISQERACRQDGLEGIRVTVADTGSGIEQDLLPKIFEPFVSTKGETGTGLGLWVTDEIAKRNGWRIAVRSSVKPEHRGTTFTLQMPVAA